MATQMNVGSATIVIEADGNEFPTQMQGQTQSALSRLGTTLADALGTTLKLGLAAVGTAAGIGLAKAIDGGMSRLIALDTAQARIANIVGEGEALDAVMRQVAESVDGTAFGLGDAANAASLMMTSGVAAGDELDAVLRGIVGTAAATGTGLSDITQIWQTMAAQGKVSGDQIYQLGTRGVNALAALAEYFGISQEAAREMVTAGEVSFEEFNAAMLASTGDLAEAMGNTFTGIRDNINSAFGRVGAAIMDPFFQAAKVVMPIFLDALKGVAAYLTPIGEAIGDKILPGIQAWADSFGPVDDRVQSFSESFKGIFDSIGAGISSVSSLLIPLVGAASGFLGPLLSQLPIVGRLFSGLSGPVGLVIGLFIEMWRNSEVLRDAFSSLFAAIGPIFSALQPAFAGLSDIIGSVAGVLGDALGTVVAALVPILVELAELVGPLLGDAFAALQPLISAVGSLLSGVLGAALSALLPAIMSIVTAALPPLVALFTSLIPPVTQIVNALLPILVSLITALAPVLAQIGPLFGQVLAAVLPFALLLIDLLMPAIQALLPLIQTVFSAIVPIIESAMGVISGIIQTVTAVISGDWSAAWEGIKNTVSKLWGTITSVIRAGVDIVVGIFTAVKDFLVGLWESIYNILVGNSIIPDMVNAIVAVFRSLSQIVTSIFNAIRAFLVGVWNGIRSTISSVINGIRSTISSVLGSIRSTWTSIWNGIKSKVSEIWSGIKRAITDGINNAMSTVRGFKDKITGFFSGAGTWLVNAGRSIIQGLVDGIKSMVSAVTGAVGNVLSAARDLLPFSPAKVGPFSGRGWTLYSGESIMDALAQGVRNEQATLVDAVRGAVGEAQAAINGAALEVRTPGEIEARRGIIATLPSDDGPGEIPLRREDLDYLLEGLVRALWRTARATETVEDLVQNGPSRMRRGVVT